MEISEKRLGVTAVVENGVVIGIITDGDIRRGLLSGSEISDPISKPKTKVAPIKPNKTPSHCLVVTFSFKIGPLKAFVSMG